ncbi:MAG: response regulator [Anaerolineae bacterium]|nr:response regulator [Anaerolineae bacterium]
MTYILLAEDDPTSLEIVRDILEAQGYRLRTARDGNAALALALDERPALVVADVMMPKISGLELIRQLKQHYESAPPPVILISALGTLNDIERGREVGADDYIIKPFSPEVLSAKVRAYHLPGP